MPGKVGYKDNIGQVFDNIKGGHTSNGFMNCEIQFFMYILNILMDQSEIGKLVLMSLKKVQNSHFAECQSNECCASDKSVLF